MATVEVVSGNQTLSATGDEGKVDTHGGEGRRGWRNGVMPLRKKKWKRNYDRTKREKIKIKGT